MYPFAGAIYITMQERLIQNIKVKIILKVFKSNHLQTNEKEYWRLSVRFTKSHQNYLLDKREKSCNKPSTCKKRNFCVKTKMVKAENPTSVNKETVRRMA